jgi:hypothetical protein
LLFVEDSNLLVRGVKSRLLYDFDQGEELAENREVLLKTLSGIAVVDRRYVIVSSHQLGSVRGIDERLIDSLISKVPHLR